MLVVCPANLTFQWQRELNEKFDEKFLVFKGGDLRDQFLQQRIKCAQTLWNFGLELSIARRPSGSPVGARPSTDQPPAGTANLAVCAPSTTSAAPVTYFAWSDAR